MGAGEKRFDDTLSREISCRNAARTIRGGDFSTLWRLCIESPSQPKLASSLHNKRLSYWRLTGFGRNDGGRGPAFFIIRGEAATTTLLHNPSTQPFYTTCHRQAVTTFGPEGR